MTPYWNYHKKKRTPNRLTNGVDFDGGTWNKVNSAVVAVINGEYRLTDGSASSNINQSVGVLELGKTYELSLEARAGTADQLTLILQRSGASFEVTATVTVTLSDNYRRYTVVLPANGATFIQRVNISVGTSASGGEGNIFIRNAIFRELV